MVAHGRQVCNACEPEYIANRQFQLEGGTPLARDRRRNRRQDNRGRCPGSLPCGPLRQRKLGHGNFGRRN